MHAEVQMSCYFRDMACVLAGNTLWGQFIHMATHMLVRKGHCWERDTNLDLALEDTVKVVLEFYVRASVDCRAADAYGECLWFGGSFLFCSIDVESLLLADHRPCELVQTHLVVLN